MLSMERWLEVGERVVGRYLTREFSGEIVDIDFGDEPTVRSYRVRFDEPIDVATSPLIRNVRRVVTVQLRLDGQSVDHKGRPDGLMNLSRAPD